MPTQRIVTGQDYENVVFNTRKPITTTTATTTTTTTAKQNIDTEGVPQKKISNAQKQSLQKFRINAGYKSQKQLAAATNGKINVARIAELENGKGNQPSGQEKQILFKLIKMKF